MPLRFTVLASGSAGNATLIRTADFGVLIDAGLGPRQLAERLAAVGLSWGAVQAVLLTHTHSDHWKDRTLAFLRRRRATLYCHPNHHPTLLTYSPAFSQLLADGLVRPFAAGEEFALTDGLRCRPFPVRHDSGATFGFRLSRPVDLFGRCVAVGYAADLGCWDDALAAQLADVDLLALEFNHEVALQHASGRPPLLIARVLGDEGHLSNAQAADLVRAVLARSGPGRLRHLVQLHLSQECNRPALARRAARAALAELGSTARLHTAEQDLPGATLRLGHDSDGRKRNGGTRKPPAAAGPHSPGPAAPAQPWLPGLGEVEKHAEPG
jgi:phosphoribosyl 1,2-cyclic phosphodiesterase